MAERLRFVADNLSTVRLDLNSSTGWHVGRGLDLGTATAEKAYLVQPPFSGATLSDSYRPLVTMTIPLILMRQTGTDAEVAAAIRTLFNSLATELDREYNNLEYRPDGYTSAGLGSYFYRTYRADIPSLMRGEFVPPPFILREAPPMMVTIEREPVTLPTSTSDYL